MCLRSLSIVAVLAAVLLLAAGAPEAAAQNVTTVEGPGAGEKTTMSLSPHRLTDDVSVRAVGVRSSDSTRWAFTLIGADRVESVSFVVGGDTLPAASIDRPNETGAVTVFMSQDAFLSLARTEGAAIILNGTRVSLPTAVRKDMQSIFSKVV
jgi:hypothetical protein